MEHTQVHTQGQTSKNVVSFSIAANANGRLYHAQFFLTGGSAGYRGRYTSLAPGPVGGGELRHDAVTQEQTKALVCYTT